MRNTNSAADVRRLEDEIEAYLLDSQASDSSLAYWQANQLRFPTLFSAALDYLAVQGSAVPCERVFSSAKETITMRRNRMGYDLMQALQMLKFTLQNHHVIDFSVGRKKEEEIAELEGLPDDAMLATNDPFSMF